MALVNAEMKNQIAKKQQDKLNEVMKKTQNIIDQMLPKQISNVSSILLVASPLINCSDDEIQGDSKLRSYLQQLSAYPLDYLCFSYAAYRYDH